jgi:CRP-like cAMP-binding protein
LIEGFAARSKTTDRGKRQVLSIHIPGEIPDLQSLHLHVMDHDMTTLSPVRAGFIPHDALRDLTRERPSIASALWRDTLVDAAIFREWIVNVRRPGPSRMAHLIVEMQSRLELIGRATKETFHLPMTQIDLADALGLTPVHVNRVLQELRKEGVLDFRNNVVTTSNLARLRAIGDFDPLYLHQAPAM